MSESNPLLGKADALMQRHRAPPDTAVMPATQQAWLPVLTDVIVRGTPPHADAAPPVALPVAPRVATPTPTDDVESLVQELTPKLTAAMEKQVAAELRKSLDDTVATLLSQLDVSVREIVRDAVAEKLKSHKPDG
jgi:hypothetical protein